MYSPAGCSLSFPGAKTPLIFVQSDEQSARPSIHSGAGTKRARLLMQESGTLMHVVASASRDPLVRQ